MSGNTRYVKLHFEPNPIPIPIDIVPSVKEQFYSVPKDALDAFLQHIVENEDVKAIYLIRGSGKFTSGIIEVVEGVVDKLLRESVFVCSLSPH